MDFSKFGIIPIAILGACVGSFLNVVVYRLPLGLSIAQPRRSFCPHCKRNIRAFDNIPIFGWLHLGGRCRDCRRAISPVYPIVEALSVLLFVAIWDALFVARVVTPAAAPLTPADGWPVFVAYLFLFAALLAMSIMDLESYTVDIRICNLTIAVGVIMDGAWAVVLKRPGAIVLSRSASALPPAVVIAAVAAGAAWLAIEIVLRFVRKEALDDPAAEMDDEEDDDNRIAAAGPAREGGVELAPEPGARLVRWIVILMVGAIIASIVWITRCGDWPGETGLTAGQIRGIVFLFAFTAMLIASARLPREADEQVFDEIESQRHEARGMAVRELAALLPAILGAVIAIALLRWRGSLATAWSQLPGGGLPGTPLWSFLTLAGHALASAVLAAALGWTVRILGTLGFGKEAFGTGDIYILAAIGAVGGFDLAILGFFLAAFLALVGVLFMFLNKRARAIPFGPWLALGAFLGLYIRPPLMSAIGPVASFFWSKLVSPAAVGG